MLSEISALLAAEGIGTEGNNLLLSMMPDKPDDCVALYEYAGSPADLHWDGEYPGLQVRVRSGHYATARSKIEDVINVLHGLCERTLSGTRYLLIRANGSPELLKYDESGRVELVVNFTVMKERKGGG